MYNNWICFISSVLTKHSNLRLAENPAVLIVGGLDVMYLFLKSTELKYKGIDNCPWGTCIKAYLLCQVLFSSVDLVIFHGIQLEFQLGFMEVSLFNTFHTCGTENFVN